MPHLRKIVYFTAIKYGGHTEWEFLWRKYKDCKNAAEREKVISALCAARNKDVLQRYELSFFTAPFNNIRTLKFKAQLTRAFFATVNQMFGGSSQLPTTAESAVIKLRCAEFRQRNSSHKLGGHVEHLIDGSKNRIYRWTF